MSVVLYAALGVVMDFLITVYYLQISAKHVFPASILGVVITLASFVIFNKIIVRWNFKLVIAYAIGTGLGTAIGILT